ncbi:thiol reductant ABC exporter subunit CydC [Corynebacterium pilosum]|uniref:ABC transport system, ATPase and permease component n=1 Tax=Corynebacterium pilosum TaxID=35756 RepID=A0A376CJU4_9CORY|nr:thiol reductant ABC exporter subunit CydC [Corynebacterium pilosum]STC68766.1 ABC transport system, ATPase and permease component [Corynebacterium pilosum]
MSDVRYLLRLAGVRRRDIALSVLAGSITLLAALTLTVLSGWLITRSWQMPPVLHLSVAITAVRALGISRAVFRYIDRLVSHKLGLSALTTLRARVYDAMASTSRPVGRGEGHVRLVTDTERVTDFIVRTVVPTGVAIVLSVVAIAFTAWLHPLAAVVMAVAMACTGLLIPWLAVRVNARRTHIDAADDFHVRLDAVLEHRVEYQAAGRADDQLTAAVDASRRASAETVKAQRPEALAEGIQAWATGFAALLVTIIAVAFYPGEPVWLGMLVMIPLAAFEAHGPLATAAIHGSEAAVAARRLKALVDKPAPAQPERDDTAAVDARGLHTVYGDTVWDFSLAPGERMLVRGPSGCGKTTMLETVAGLLPAAAGEVTRPAGARFFAEDGWVFSTTVRENLHVAAPEASDELMAEVLDAVGFEFGLDFVLADGAESLSSGQRRRLLLARALCSDAEVLLLDEPTEHLSPDAAEELLHMVLHEPLPGALPERTVIAVAHTDGPVGVEVFEPVV